MNNYELAAERFERISRSIKEIKALAQGVIDWADAEYTAAGDNLAKYETSPGIPLPEYRQQDRGLASCGHPADEDGECSCSYWPERAPLEA